MSAAAATFPNWAMLEPFVFRRDDDGSFPDAAKAPIRASGTTSWGATFTIAFSLADPPLISRLYAQLPVPGFPDPRRGRPLAILVTHRHLALLRVATETSAQVTVQDFFIYNSAADEDPSSSSLKLKALPPCTEPPFDYTRSDHRLPRCRRPPPPPEEEKHRRLLTIASMGLLCRADEEFALCGGRAESLPAQPPLQVDADSDSSTSPGDQLGLGGAWNSMRVEILCSDDDDGWQPCGGWQTNAVIPFRRQWLCWVDYYQGILLCDVFRDPSPSVSFLRLPLDSACTANIRAERFTCLYYRAVSVVDDGRVLKFVNVTRHDGVPFGTLKPGTGFTITCHTLLMSDGGGMAWEEDYKVTSDQLWDANLPEHLPRDILMYPQVDIERPHVVHFLFISQWKYAKKKMSVVSIDMSTMAVESLSPYINGHEGLQTDDADLIRDKSMSPMAFLPCEFPKYLSRKIE
ncbi:unnamed protein product [Urochloa decumbens]|uniref:DUF1618 domain-containing protein n=1 Tax=Urochloa decumbens TaxID=240449 RepID=A0ABC9F754_9POAL